MMILECQGRRRKNKRRLLTLKRNHFCLLLLVVLLLSAKAITRLEIDKWFRLLHLWIGREFYPVKQLNGHFTIPFRTLHIADMGNQMFELAALLALARSLNRTAFLQPDCRKNFRYKFGRSFPHFPLKPFNFWIDTKLVKRNSQGNNENPLAVYPNIDKTESLTFDGEYFQSWRYFYHMIDEIREYFRFAHSDLRMAREVFLQNGLNRSGLFCVHARDFPFRTRLKSSDFLKIIRFIRSEKRHEMDNIQEITFLLISDNEQWSRAIISQINSEWLKAIEENVKMRALILDKKRREKNRAHIVDMAVMARFCPVLFLTSLESTFGLWAALLADPNYTTVYYYGRYTRSLMGRTFNEDRALPAWTPMDLTLSLP